MRALAIAFVFSLIGCTENKTNITQVVGPTDWQPPVIEWQYQPNAEVRGTVGIDVVITDTSEVTWARLYVDGLPSTELHDRPYRFEIHTDSLADGVHILEARAQDTYENLGISPILRINVVNSVAQGPRLLWVPDSFTTIQSAINASTDLDTIRVRDGVYNEILNTFGKGIWMESQSGPLVTRLNGRGSNSVITISPNYTMMTVRGFWIVGAERLVRFELGGQASFFNNIFLEDTASALLYSTYSGGQIRNNLFSGARNAVEIGYHWGDFINNIVTNAGNAGFWNAAVATNPIEYAYNMYWNNGHDYDEFAPGDGDSHSNPMIDLVNGRLEPDSPARNSGMPDIQDSDSTRSDIGPFGGPWAY